MKETEVKVWHLQVSAGKPGGLTRGYAAGQAKKCGLYPQWTESAGFNGPCLDTLLCNQFSKKI